MGLDRDTFVTDPPFFHCRYLSSYLQNDESGKTKKEIGVELHSGKNRIVRRIFEALGYEVVKLDRMIFAGLNKKDLPRGRWRFLTEKEVNFLKMIK